MPCCPLRTIGGQNQKMIFRLKKKILFFFRVFYDSNDPISTHMNDKRMSNAKSAPQVTPAVTKTRKMTYDVIKVH